MPLQAGLGWCCQYRRRHPPPPPAAAHSTLRSCLFITTSPRHSLSNEQDAQARGREVLLPVGCSDLDEWLLDALSVDRLLKQLRAGAGAKLDLINATVSTSTGPLAAGVGTGGGRRDSWQTPPRGSAGGGGLEDTPVVDFRSLLVGTPGGTPGDSTQQALAGDEADAHLPQLRLRSLQVGASAGCRVGLG